MTRYNLIHTKYRQTAFRSPAEGTPLSPYQRSFGTTYSRVRNKHSPMLIDFVAFFQRLWAYSKLHRAYFSIISIKYKQGYACRLFFLQNFPGAMFIQGATFIPDSRVGGLVPGKNCVTKNTCQ